MEKNEVRFRPATMAEIEGRDTDLYMDGERVWVMMIHRSETIGEGEAKLDFIMLTNMKKVQVEDLQVIDNNNNEPISENTTMAQNVKAADLIGKVIIVGDNQGTITVKGVQDNGMLACEFSKAGEDATTPMAVTLPNLQKMTERGLWKIREANEPSAVSPQTSEVTTEADVQEVQDIVPVVTRKPASEREQNGTCSDSAEREQTRPQVKPTPKAEEPKEEKPAAIVKPIGKPKQEKPKAKTQPSAVKPQTSKYVYATYQTSKGKTGAKITGVSETDAAYQQAAAIHASGSYTKDKDGNKHYYLCFGPRYAEAAKKVCELLNAGKPIEDAIAIIDKATEERAVKREEARAKREERNAQPSKDYSKEDVAEMLRKVLAGGDVPEDIKAILKAA